MPTPMPSCIPLILCLSILLLPPACSSIPSGQTSQPQLNPIQNLHQLTPGLYSGDEPATAAHYQQLASLGIKTVISVDAIAPDPELASSHNIRIVHLPIGYDGIDPDRVNQLAAAIHQLDHPIFLHCHHGKHRGPTALAVGAIGAGLITNDQALEFMTLIGTSENYPGLWNAARNATPLDPSTLSAEFAFPEREPISGFISGMGQLDRLHEQLWDLAENNWQPDEYHPDHTPTAISGQIYDHSRSMLDLEFFKHNETTMQSQLEAFTKTAHNLESELSAENYQAALRSLDTLSKSCIDCHDRFRN